MKTADIIVSWRFFPAERAVPEHAKAYGVQVRLDAMQLHRPRQWGAGFRGEAQRVLSEADLHVFAKFGEKGLEWRLEPETFARR